MSKPNLLAKAISHNVVIKPPSDRSWYARSLRDLRSLFIHSTKAGISSTHSTSGESPLLFPITCENMLPPILLFPFAKSTNKIEVSCSSLS